MRKGSIGQRLSFYLMGLFIMTIGIALSVKSNLGVSPISSIPYTMTVVWGIEMGKATILLHCALVGLQIALLRRQFDWRQLLQVAVGIVFGSFTTFCNWLVGFLPAPPNLAWQLGLSLSSTVLVALGIFFYLPSNLIPLAGEGAIQAIATLTHLKFPQVKVGNDVTMVVLSTSVCLIAVHQLGSVGIGTVLAAFLVGIVLNVIMHYWGAWRYHFNPEM